MPQHGGVSAPPVSFGDRMQRSYVLALLAMLNLQKLLAMIRCSTVFVDNHREFAHPPTLLATCLNGENALRAVPALGAPARRGAEVVPAGGAEAGGNPGIWLSASSPPLRVLRCCCGVEW
jgi:hypothetical protein